ncbi:nSTAND1 domain-containing NTPase, partial [Leptothoe sp. PORK10 BA2]|uniref:nSTAND1 domain-containing NTPase n=1 Tax=Leptothoe sp. PORK10 BA2 TaxID=3110254 RepID=UPI002B21D3A3
MNLDALVVGINNYEHLPEDRQLRAPANDAELIAQRLEAEGVWQVTRLPEAGTKSGKRRVSSQKMLAVQELEAAIEDLFYPDTQRNKPDAALLYFSGHGLRKVNRRRSEGFLAASDVHPEDDRWGISLKWLQELLQDSPVAAQVVWLDCCHSGELLNFEEGNPGEQGRARDRCFIAASQDHRLAYEGGGKVPYSDLTRVLWQGLDTAEGDVTSFDLQRFVDDDFSQQTQRQQRPLFQTSGNSILLVPGAKKPQQVIAQVIREENPYQGLNAFTQRTAEFFFGREAAAQEILQKLSQSPFVPVIGVSGSGKSSVVRAGVMARLGTSARWMVLPAIKPGDSPIDPVNEISRVLIQACAQDSQKPQVAMAMGNGNLAGAVDLLPGDENLLLVVDQFEEIFTVCPPEQEAERQRFLKLLVDLSQQPDSRLRVVTTMRADFFEQCLTYREFGKVIKRQQVLLLPMDDDQLQAAIVEPAAVQGYGFEPRLLELILEDVATESNCLPLLQFALTQLWEQRDPERHVLTEAAYRNMGRLMGALNSHAESIYGGTIADVKLRLRSDEQRGWARRICLKLVRTGMAAKDTRQRQPLSLVLGLGQSPAEEQTIREVIKVLVDGRLLVQGSAVAMAAETALERSTPAQDNSKPDDVWIDLAHEALLEGCARFRQWRQENRDLRRLVQRVEDGEKEWQQKGKQEGYLLQGGLLAEVREQWEMLEAELGQSTQRYYQESEQREQDQVAFLERALTESRLREEAMQILNLTRVRPRPDTAVRAIRAVGASNQTLDGHILTPVQNNLPAVVNQIHECGCLRGHSDAVLSVAFSPDGQTVVSGSNDKTIRLWDLNGTPIGEPFEGHSASVRSVAFSPDGKTVVSGSDDNTIRLWDLNGTPIGEPFEGHSSSVLSVAFSPDGKTVVSGSSDNTIRLWDLNGTPIGEPFEGHSASVRSVAFSPDGKTVVSGSDDN